MTTRSIDIGPARLLLTTLMFLAVALPDALAQDSYPNRLVRVIVPTGPGAGNDLQARLIAQQLSERLGQQVVVENRVGAATMIGSDFVAKSSPDGYTLLMNVSTPSIRRPIRKYRTTRYATSRPLHTRYRRPMWWL